MSMNQDRADWALEAIAVFASEVMNGEISEDTFTDLVGDLGHFARRELKLNREEILNLYQIGIGAWLAEEDDPEGEPEGNYYVKIAIE